MLKAHAKLFRKGGTGMTTFKIYFNNKHSKPFKVEAKSAKEAFDKAWEKIREHEREYIARLSVRASKNVV